MPFHVQGLHWLRGQTCLSCGNSILARSEDREWTNKHGDLSRVFTGGTPHGKGKRGRVAEAGLADKATGEQGLETGAPWGGAFRGRGSSPSKGLPPGLLCCWENLFQRGCFCHRRNPQNTAAPATAQAISIPTVPEAPGPSGSRVQALGSELPLGLTTGLPSADRLPPPCGLQFQPDCPPRGLPTRPPAPQPLH